MPYNFDGNGVVVDRQAGYILIQVESVLQGTPAADKCLPVDLIWTVNGRLIGPNIIDFDMAINKSIQDSVVLTIFRNGGYQDITIPLYNLEAHRITRIVQFGGAVFLKLMIFLANSVALHPEFSMLYGTIQYHF